MGTIAAGPAGAVGTGGPGFYTDEFHFDFQNEDQTAICGFPVGQTVDGYVHGWDRGNADGSHPDGSDTGSARGLMLLVVVPGWGAAVDAGRLMVTFPPGGGRRPSTSGSGTTSTMPSLAAPASRARSAACSRAERGQPTR
jgi:hypothetical protein